MNIAEVNYLLCSIADPDETGSAALTDVVERSLRGGVTVVLLRAKLPDSAGIAAIGNKLHPVCRQYHVPLIIEGDVVAAMMCNADGVHLTPDDMSLSHARKLLGPDRIIGVTVNDPSQAKAAFYGSADYLRAGDAASAGVNEICEAVPIPVVSDEVTAEQLTGGAECKLSGYTLVSAIYAEKDVESVTRQLVKTIRKVLGK